MPSPTIDPELCTALLQNAAEQIPILSIRSSLDRNLSSVIQQVKKVSQISAQQMRRQLSALYPEIGWSEEEQHHRSSDTAYWVHDPIDGAYHYAQGLPLWSSSLALIRCGTPVFSVVYDPTRAETFVAVQGEGVTCNGTQVSVSTKIDLDAAVVGTTIPPLAQVGKAELSQALANIDSVSERVFVIRPMAAVSLQMAYVAAGRLDAFWESGNDVSDWLAGSLLVTEGGGVVSDLLGRPFGGIGEGILAGNTTLHDSLLPIFSTVIENRARLSKRSPSMCIV